MANSSLKTDVAIIGGGGAGIPAAIEVARGGGKAIVLEQAVECGGTAAISGGGCCIVGTPLQKSQGIEDTPDMAFEDWIKWGGGAADEVWARYYLEHTLHDLYHWAESCGAKWVDMKFQEGNRVLRWHRPDNNGLGLMTALIKTAEVDGKHHDHDFGERRQAAHAKWPSLRRHRDQRTTNLLRFTANPSSSRPADSTRTSTWFWNTAPSSKNSKSWKVRASAPRAKAIQMIRELGGYFTHMEHIWFYVYATPDYRDPQQRRGLVFRMVPGYIWFNQQGKRFHNESVTGGASATPALLAQSPPHAWALADTPMLAKIDVADPYYRRGDVIDRAKVEELLNNSPFIKKADTLEELGKKCGVEDVQNFVAEIEAYNECFDAGLTRIRSSANRSKARRSSTRRRITRFRFFHWRGKTLAA